MRQPGTRSDGLPVLTTAEKVARNRARSNLNRAVRRGLITRGTCRYAANGHCNGPIEGHHYLGYAKAHQLDVQWYCHKHHALREKMEPRLAHEAQQKPAPRLELGTARLRIECSTTELSRQTQQTAISHKQTAEATSGTPQASL